LPDEGEVLSPAHEVTGRQGFRRHRRHRPRGPAGPEAPRRRQ
jgi:hypothetical protein